MYTFNTHLDYSCLKLYFLPYQYIQLFCKRSLPPVAQTYLPCKRQIPELQEKICRTVTAKGRSPAEGQQLHFMCLKQFMGLQQPRLSPRTDFCFPELSSIRTKRSDTDTTPCSSPLPSCSLTDRATDAHRAFKLQGLPLVLMANIASVRKDSCLPVLLPLPAVSEVPGHKQNSRRHPSSITLLPSHRNISEL